MNEAWMMTMKRTMITRDGCASMTGGYTYLISVGCSSRRRRDYAVGKE